MAIVLDGTLEILAGEIQERIKAVPSASEEVCRNIRDSVLAKQFRRGSRQFRDARDVVTKALEERRRAEWLSHASSTDEEGRIEPPTLPAVDVAHPRKSCAPSLHRPHRDIPGYQDYASGDAKRRGHDEE